MTLIIPVTTVAVIATPQLVEMIELNEKKDLYKSLFATIQIQNNFLIERWVSENAEGENELQNVRQQSNPQVDLLGLHQESFKQVYSYYQSYLLEARQAISTHATKEQVRISFDKAQSSIYSLIGSLSSQLSSADFDDGLEIINSISRLQTTINHVDGPQSVIDAHKIHTKFKQQYDQLKYQLRNHIDLSLQLHNPLWKQLNHHFGYSTFQNFPPDQRATMYNSLQDLRNQYIDFMIKDTQLKIENKNNHIIQVLTSLIILIVCTIVTHFIMRSKRRKWQETLKKAVKDNDVLSRLRSKGFQELCQTKSDLKSAQSELNQLKLALSQSESELKLHQNRISISEDEYKKCKFQLEKSIEQELNMRHEWTKSKEENKDISKKLKDTSSFLSEANKLVTEWTIKAENLENEASEHAKQLWNLQVKERKAQKELQSKLKTLQITQEELNEALSSRKGLEERLDTLATDLSNSNKELSQTIKQRDSAHAEQLLMQGIISNLESELYLTHSHSNQKIEEFNSQIKTLNDELSAKGQELKNSVKSINKLQAMNHQQSQSLQKVEQKAERLLSQRDQSFNEKLELKKSLSESEDKLLQVTNRTHKSHREAMEKQIHEYQELEKTANKYKSERDFAHSELLTMRLDLVKYESLLYLEENSHKKSHDKLNIATEELHHLKSQFSIHLEEHKDYLMQAQILESISRTNYYELCSLNKSNQSLKDRLRQTQVSCQFWMNRSQTQQKSLLEVKKVTSKKQLAPQYPDLRPRLALMEHTIEGYQKKCLHLEEKISSLRSNELSLSEQLSKLQNDRIRLTHQLKTLNMSKERQR